MAFNNGFPVTYPQYYPYQQPLQGTQMSPANQQTGIIWVQGEAGAKSYLVAPNNTVQLWDSEAQVIYLKSADASGMPSMKVLDYTIRDARPIAPAIASNYVTKEDLKAQLDALRKELANEPSV